MPTSNLNDFSSYTTGITAENPTGQTKTDETRIKTLKEPKPPATRDNPFGPTTTHNDSSEPDKTTFTPEELEERISDAIAKTLSEQQGWKDTEASLDDNDLLSLHRVAQAPYNPLEPIFTRIEQVIGDDSVKDLFILVAVIGTIFLLFSVLIAVAPAIFLLLKIAFTFSASLFGYRFLMGLSVAISELAEVLNVPKWTEAFNELSGAKDQKTEA